MSGQLEPDEIITQLRGIPPEVFEELVADVWRYLGYDTEVTQASGDKGIDIIATRSFPYDERIVIQAKRYGAGSTVSGPEMQKYGSLARRDQVDSVIVVSTGGFTRQAKELADEFNIKLIDGTALARLLIEEDIVELVLKYTDGVMPDSDQQKRSPHLETADQIEGKTTVGEGSYLTIEVVGYGLVPDEDYQAVCLHVSNKASRTWEFNTYDVSVTSIDGFAYECTSWAHQISPWSGDPTTEIRRDTTARIAMFFKTSELFHVRRIEYEGEVRHCLSGINAGDPDSTDEVEVITVPLDDSVRDEVDTIPESLPLEDANIEFY